MGEFNQAIAQYIQLADSGSVMGAANAGLARVYLKLKRPDDAYSAAAKAVELDPSLATAHSALGEVYFRQGALPEARSEFQSALKLDQTDARAYLGLYRWYEATFNFKRAKVAIDDAHLIDPGDPEINSAWIQTRPLSERVRFAEDAVASTSQYYSRSEKADFKQRIVAMKDQIEHPERTCSLAVRPESAELPLRPIISNDRPYPGVALDVLVNGREMRLLLSTSGSGLVIGGNLAKRAKVQPIVHSYLDDLGDQNPPEGHIGFSHSVVIGKLVFQNCYVFVVDQSSPDSFFDRVKGTVGLRMFSSYSVDLDIPEEKLKLRPLPPRPSSEDENTAQMDRLDPEATEFHDRYVAPEMADWEQIYRFGGQFIPVRVNGTPPKFFNVSTSFAVTVVSTQLARQSTYVTRDNAWPVYGVNGAVRQTFRTGPVNLEFDNLSYTRMAEHSVDLKIDSEKAGTEMSGILGFDILRNFDIKFDFRDGLIHFDDGKKHE